MHRTVEAAVPTSCTDKVIDKLKAHECVIGLSAQKGASIKPAGDILQIHVLNRGADDVLRIIASQADTQEVSIVTSEVASISDSKH